MFNNDIKAIIYVICSLFSAGYAGGKNLENFPKEHQILILKFRQLAFGADTNRQAFDFLADTKQKIESGEIKNFKATDLFTTYFLSSYQGSTERASVLSEYCQHQFDPENHKKYYDIMLAKL